MNDFPPATDILQLHEAIKASVSLAFPNTFVDFYPRPGEQVQTPAILLEMEEIDSEDDGGFGTEQIEVSLKFNAYCLMSYKSGNKLALRSMAACLVTHIHRQRWGVPVGPARSISARQDSFGGPSDEYETMRVEFEHDAILGLSVWDDSGVVPISVFVGEAPKIGPPNIADYTPIHLI